MKGRITAHRRLCCPVKDAGFSVRHNKAVYGEPWWVHYEHGGRWIPADLPHEELVEVVNELKVQEGQTEGGAFSINEHGQVIARTSAAQGQSGSVQIIGVSSAGKVYAYPHVITFDGGRLDPTEDAVEGQSWPGPHCGISYSLAAPGATHPPSRVQDEISMSIEGQLTQLSSNAGISPYPPVAGPLRTFLQTLRRQLPPGGRFRVNEHGRAFTSDESTYIGQVPLKQWFRPLHPRS
ncbi:MAG TPA: hypothetical protein DCQ33_01910 [Nitrospira sp.]|nr:hypothetical protein [Nitrospira sp.]